MVTPGNPPAAGLRCRATGAGQASADRRTQCGSLLRQGKLQIFVVSHIAAIGHCDQRLKPSAPGDELVQPIGRLRRIDEPGQSWTAQYGRNFVKD
jgi:hypothetical protein